jgi:hypothetical protein
MIGVNSTQNKSRKQNLLSSYVNAPQFGLVLGAGVTACSHVPMYEELALRLLECASNDGKLSVSADWVGSFVQQQRRLLAEKRKTVPPEEVILFVRKHLDGGVEQLRQLVKRTLYESASVAETVGREVFESNTTLDAILTFCASRPNTVLSPLSNPPASKHKRKIETNIRVGGILTTNYDNLVEGAFHTKYRYKLLKPVGRPQSRESASDRRLIPVYHVHGYVRYRTSKSDGDEPKGPDIVIAEDDYFEKFYDPLGFGSYIAMSFLRRFPCLFIGCSMKDKNLRRFLFHLAQGIGKAKPYQRKFAILPMSGTSEDELTDAILQHYGVETIWIQAFDEIPDILRSMYTAIDGVTGEDWDYVATYRWRPAGTAPRQASTRR